MTWLFHIVSYGFQFFFCTRTESLRQHTMPFVTYPTTQGMPWPAVGLLSLGPARARSARLARSARCRWGIISCPMTPSMCPGPTSPRFVWMTWWPDHLGMVRMSLIFEKMRASLQAPAQILEICKRLSDTFEIVWTCWSFCSSLSTCRCNRGHRTFQSQRLGEGAQQDPNLDRIT